MFELRGFAAATTKVTMCALGIAHCTLGMHPARPPSTTAATSN